MSRVPKEKSFNEEYVMEKRDQDREKEQEKRREEKKKQILEFLSLYFFLYSSHQITELRGKINVEACILLDFHEFRFKLMIHSIFLKIGIWFIHILK